jgi:dephospho-CoA kinase
MRISFVGKAGCGKTSLANHLTNSHQNFVKLSFATPLKKFAEEILMRSIDKTDPLDRKFLQQLGTELGRARQKDIWIKHFDKNLNKDFHFVQENAGMYCLQPYKKCNFVVDDCRFLNEAEYLKSNGFIIIKITGRQLDMGENASHASEVEQDQIIADHELDNSGSYSQAICKLYEIMINYDGNYKR